MSENIAKEIISMIDDDGKESKFQLLGIVEYNDDEYIVLSPYQMEGFEDGEIAILKVFYISEEDEKFVPVEDEPTLEAVINLFLKKADQKED